MMTDTRCSSTNRYPPSQKHFLKIEFERWISHNSLTGWTLRMKCPISFHSILSEVTSTSLCSSRPVRTSLALSCSFSLLPALSFPLFHSCFADNSCVTRAISPHAVPVRRENSDATLGIEAIEFTRPTSRELRLFCWVQGDDPNTIHEVKIPGTMTVTASKEAIKKTAEPALDHVPADALKLWKVSASHHVAAARC